MARKKPHCTVADVCTAMEAWVPRALAFPKDPIGLEIGDPQSPVTRILAVLSVTQKAFARARQIRAEMLIAHHPLFFRPLYRLRTDDPATRLRLDIAAGGIACYAAHTNLDLAQGGVNDLLAERLELTGVTPLFDAPHAGQVKLICFVPDSHLAVVRDAVCLAGAGTIGDYTHCTFSTEGVGTFRPGAGTTPYSGQKGRINEEPERRFEVLTSRMRLSDVLAALFSAHPYEEVAYDIVPLENPDPAIGLGRRGALSKPMALGDFAGTVRAALETEYVRVVGDANRPVQMVAVLGGSGGGELSALPNDIDVCVTGDVRYHEALDAKGRELAVIDAGHVSTEKWIAPAVARHLRRAIPGLRVSVFMESEPFQVVP